jgi:hypothetical protein
MGLQMSGLYPMLAAVKGGSLVHPQEEKFSTGAC